MTYRQSKGATDVTFAPEAGGALTNGAWSTAGIVDTGSLDAGGYWSVTARDGIPISDATQRFMRLKVTRP